VDTAEGHSEAGLSVQLCPMQPLPEEGPFYSLAPGHFLLPCSRALSDFVFLVEIHNSTWEFIYVCQ
jgi:hypothetical protein